MDTQFHSFEWYDAISRQGSKFSRTSFNTARTDHSIYYECEEFEDNIKSELDSSCNQSKNYCSFKKSVTIKFPEVFPRSETRSTNKSEGYCKLSNRCSKGQLNERIRSKTAPHKKFVFDFIDNISYENVFFIQPSGNEFPNNTNSLSKNSITKTEFTQKENERTISSRNVFENFSKDTEPSSVSTDSLIEKYIFTQGNQDIYDSLEKEQEICLQKSCSENAQSLESFEVDLNEKRPVLEIRSFSYNTINRTLFNIKALSIKSASKVTESIPNVEKNKNFDIKQLHIDLPNIFVEGETEIRRKYCQSDCIFSKFLNCKNMCCLLD
ncbi:uncharacterized protein cubi_00616 [Cryptosporidium ubiquitum]|uniref:Uncharacterized protein n=1 Tax=Cryptosporidium ubiquitum TaxID=857276 RepID=A0A1J4MC47_9CRYT|nr:uncharacterized protein cubi_00616 [Cryptosporidium ubiquitum]OII71808.1 hypothetical protein cubi_00616 [Cryptosporidium ubiquitum]